ncbi:MAG: cell wall hydrolase [Altererythrobacter sp.]|nr:cell wall hydrolase [Altererythrobacter sp.]
MIHGFRAGAFATATLLFMALSGVAMSGARAEIQVPQAIQPVIANPDLTMPRFVAQPVVQPLPTDYGAASEAASLAQLVDTMPDAPLTGDLQCLAEAVYFEARGEPLDGQLAVAEVVINRSQSGRFPADYCSVVTQPAQFSFVRRGVIPRPNIGSAAWSQAKAIAQIAHQDLWDSDAKDAMFFHATSVKPKWARRKTALTRIDTHVFYR